MSDFRFYTPEQCTGTGDYPPEWHDTIKHEVRSQAANRCVRCQHPYLVGESGHYEGTSEARNDIAAAAGVSGRTVEVAMELSSAELVPVDAESLKKARRTNWSTCDELCDHGGPRRFKLKGSDDWVMSDGDAPYQPSNATAIEASWRILTVHHLDGVKGNCRWWNLVALCQRCHLQVQGKVQMPRIYPFEHTDWFKPYVAGYYAFVYLGEDLDRPATEARQDELLALERVA
jgi:hypothetical protein